MPGLLPRYRLTVATVDWDYEDEGEFEYFASREDAVRSARRTIRLPNVETASVFDRETRRTIFAAE